MYACSWSVLIILYYALNNKGMIYTDERSHYSGRSNYSGRSHNSSASSIGSRSKYFVNGLKARVSQS
jgi:hypothetical protein